MFKGIRATMNRSDEAVTTTLTTQPHNLEDFECYVLAAAKVAELRRQNDDLGARLLEADRRMRERGRDCAIPPPGHDREVTDINQRIAEVRAQISEAKLALQSATANAATVISKGMKPHHDRLRARIIAALTELHDTFEEERIFRGDLDRRGVLSAAVIQPATVVELAAAGKLEVIIAGLKGGF
jgi:hypothetical protein